MGDVNRRQRAYVHAGARRPIRHAGHRNADAANVEDERAESERVSALATSAPEYAPLTRSDSHGRRARTRHKAVIGASQRSLETATGATHSDVAYATQGVWPPDAEPAYLCRLWNVKALMVVGEVRCRWWWCVGALWGRGVSADAQAYFGTRLGVGPGSAT
jgi:hypothetical protein